MRKDIVAKFESLDYTAIPASIIRFTMPISSGQSKDNIEKWNWRMQLGKLGATGPGFAMAFCGAAILSMIPAVTAMDADPELGGTGYRNRLSDAGGLLLGGGAAIALDRIRYGARDQRYDTHPRPFLLATSRMLAGLMIALAGAYSLVVQDSSAPEWLLYSMYGAYFGATVAFLLVGWNMRQIGWPGCLTALLVALLNLFVVPGMYDGATRAGPLFATGCTFLVVYFKDLSQPLENLFWFVIRILQDGRVPVDNMRM